MKKCNRCEIEKELVEFGIIKSKKNNYIPKYNSICKICACEKSKVYQNNPDLKEKRKIYNREYKQRNKSEILKYNQDWAKNNPEQYKSTKKKIYEKVKVTDEYKTKKSIYHKQYRIENKEKLQKYHNEYISNRKITDLLFLIKEYYKGMISKCFNKNGVVEKSKHTNDILGCSYEAFKEYLESKFESWMTWENRALYNGELNYGWDIDHIIPLSSARNEEELVKLNHYTNLQPLCSYTNRYIKRDKY